MPRTSPITRPSRSLALSRQGRELVLPGLAYLVLFAGLSLAAAVLPGLESLPLVPPDHLPAWRAPDAEYWFGRDAAGRDMMGAVLGGLGRSACLALAATVAGVGAGLLIGVPFFLLGREGGYRALSWCSGQLQLVPAVVLGLLVVSRFGGGAEPVAWCLASLCGIVTAGRLGRWLGEGEERGDVIAARALGFGKWRILAHHLAPGLLPRAGLLVATLLPSVLLLESALGFVAMAPPGSEKLILGRIGEVIASGRSTRFEAPWLVFYPGLMLSLLLAGLAGLAWSVRRAVDRPVAPRWF